MDSLYNAANREIDRLNQELDRTLVEARTLENQLEAQTRRLIKLFSVLPPEVSNMPAYIDFVNSLPDGAYIVALVDEDDEVLTKMHRPRVLYEALKLAQEYNEEGVAAHRALAVRYVKTLQMGV